jgi:hypothetical protein
MGPIGCIEMIRSFGGDSAAINMMHLLDMCVREWNGLPVMTTCEAGERNERLRWSVERPRCASNFIVLSCDNQCRSTFPFFLSTEKKTPREGQERRWDVTILELVHPLVF